MLNLDTHIFLFALAGKLTAREAKLLEADTWAISGIVLWEIAKLRQLGRITLDIDSPALKRAIAALHVWPVDWETARRSTELDFDSDPADEIIAATSLVHDIPLVTRDKRMRKSKLVRIAG